MSVEELPASVQFHDNLEVITELSQRRFSYRKIWMKLKDEGKYTGDYGHFCRLAKAEFGEKKRISAPRTNSTSKKQVAVQKTETKIIKENKKSQKDDIEKAAHDDQEGPLMFMADLSAKKKK